jgi:hypothetical protein
MSLLGKDKTTKAGLQRAIGIQTRLNEEYSETIHQQSSRIWELERELSSWRTAAADAYGRIRVTLYRAALKQTPQQTAQGELEVILFFAPPAGVDHWRILCTGTTVYWQNMRTHELSHICRLPDVREIRGAGLEDVAYGVLDAGPLERYTQ